MEFINEDQSLDEVGEPETLTDKEIKNIKNLIQPNKKDVFYDLGSGYGQIVRYFCKNTSVKKSIGIESDIKRFLISIEKTRDEFNKTELKRIDFWFSDYEKYDFSDATIIYLGIDEIQDYPSYDNDQIKIIDKFFKEKEIKIIKRDFPFLGYKSVNSVKTKDGSWFFLMKTPLKRYQIKNKNEWIRHVFRRNKTEKQIAEYYVKAYEKRNVPLPKSSVSEFLRDFRRISKKRFI